MRNFLRKVLIAICILFCGAHAFAQTTYDWTGAVSTDWSNPANWESTTGGVITIPAVTYPGPTDQARVGVLLLTNTANFPVISSGGATSVGSIVWGTENYLSVSLVVNTTFTVNGDINNTSAVAGNGTVSAYSFNLSGTGTFNVTGNLNIGYDDGFATSNPGNNNTFAFNSSINALNINGSVYLNVFQGDTKHRGFVPQFNVTGGAVTTTSVQSILTNSTTVNKLLTADLTVGNSSGIPTATLKLTGATALPSFSPYVTNTITFDNPGATVEYSGGSQTVYTDTSVPNLSNTINYYSIKFSGTGLKTALSGNLNIAGDFTNTMANDGCSCNTVVLSAPTVNFDGTTQSLYGGGGSGTTFYTVDFSNSGTKSMLSGTFNLASTGVLTMMGSSTSLAAGNGIFTLLSDVSSTATVAALPLGTSITGNVNVQRFFQGSSSSTTKRGYRLISSTVYTGTAAGSKVFDLKYLLNSILVSGASGTANGFNITTSTNNASIYIFREDDAPPPVNGTLFYTTYNWKSLAKINNSNTYDIGTQKRLTTTNVADTTTTIPVGNGVLAFFRGNTTLSNGTTAGTKTTVPFNYPEDVTTTQTGVLNTFTVNVKLWFANASNNLGNKFSYTTSYVNSGTSSLRGGFTCVGNPYASTINWEKYNRNGANSSIYGTVSSTIWIFNEASNQYQAYIPKASISSAADTSSSINPGTATGSASNMIASGQGFFVKATATGQTLSFRETAKTNTQPVASSLHNLMGKPKEFAMQPEPLLRLKLSKDSINTDEIVIRLNNNASTKFVENEDAEDLGGSNALVSLSAFSSDTVALAIDFRPFPGLQQQVIPLLTSATASGLYQLARTQLDNLPALYDVWLKDAFMADSLDLKANSIYLFRIDKSNPATFGNNRFSIVIRQNPAYAYQLLDFTATKISTPRQVQLVWKTANEQNYTNFTVERSTNGGKTFDVAGGLHGTGAGIYSLLDKNPVDGQNFYRLKQEDINSTIAYSKVVAVQFAGRGNQAGNKVRIYPNPTANIINVEMDPDLKVPAYHVSIVDALGTVVKESTFQQNTWNTNISNLKPGSYLVQVTNNNDKSPVGTVTFVKN